MKPMQIQSNKPKMNYAQTYQNSPKNQNFEDDGKSFKAVFYQPGRPKLKNTEVSEDD